MGLFSQSYCKSTTIRGKINILRPSSRCLTQFFKVLNKNISSKRQVKTARQGIYKGTKAGSMRH